MEFTDEQLKAAAHHLASKGGRAGGPARAAKLSPERRRAIAIKAGKARGKQKTAEKKARLAAEKSERKAKENNQ